MDPLSEQGARPSHATVQSWPRREGRSGYRCGPLAADDRRSSLHHAWTLAVAGRSVWKGLSKNGQGPFRSAQTVTGEGFALKEEPTRRDRR
jgi:hypothetical protein